MAITLLIATVVLFSAWATLDTSGEDSAPSLNSEQLSPGGRGQ
ncbi:hypothetical protein [Dietzia kunjamensis]